MFNEEKSFEFEIQEEATKKLSELFKPFREAETRFKNGKETLNDLLNYCPNYKMTFEIEGKEKKVDFVETKYYKKLIKEVKKLNKINDLMAKELNNLHNISDNDCFIPREYSDINDCVKKDCIDCIKQYFEDKVGKKKNNESYR